MKPMGGGISDLKGKLNIDKWTSESIVVQPEAGNLDKVDGTSKDTVKKEFHRSQKLKAMYDQALKDGGIKPVLFDAEGSPIKRGAEPEYKQESVSVMKGSVDPRAADTLSDFFESIEAADSKTSPEEIKNSMGVKPHDMKVGGKKAVIGTFNIEWLGTKKRKEEDYKQIAEVIKDTGAQVLGIEEVADERGLKRVMKYLPDHSYIISRSGKKGEQRTGVIFDKKRVKYNVNSIDQIDEVVVSQGLRAPLVVDMKVDGGFDFTFVVAHLKARFDAKSLKKRKKQAQAMNSWLNDHLKKNGDKDVIIVGDLNDFVGSDALNTMAKGNVLQYATSEAKDGFYSNIRYESTIDHGGLTSVPGGAMEEYISGSLQTVDENDYNKYTQKISDHKPVFFEVRSDVDNDE